MHPLVLSITGVVEPSTGLQSKFSTLHSAAVALIDGAAGTAQYSDAKATDPAVAALRRKVKPVADETLRKDEAHAVIVAGGKRHEVAYRARQRHRRKSDERCADRGEVPGQRHAGDRRRARANAPWNGSRRWRQQPDMRELIALLRLV